MSRVSWGSILVGCVVSVALMIVFTIFGIGIGAAVLDPLYDQNPGAGLGTGSGIYLIVTQLIALGVGGYVAARLAGVPRTIASVLHGAAVWAIATIILAWSAVAGGGAMFGAASTVLDRSASVVGSIGRAVVPERIGLPDLSRLTRAMSIDQLPPEIQETLRERGITEQDLRREATLAFRNVFSQEEQSAVISEARTTLDDILQSPRDAGSDLGAFFDRLVEGPDAILSQEDIEEAQATMERRLGITPQEAEQIAQSVREGVQNAITQARTAIEEARTQAVEAAQTASEAVSTAALLLTLASVLGLLAAAGGAFAGRPATLIGDRVTDHV